MPSTKPEKLTWSKILTFILVLGVVIAIISGLAIFFIQNNDVEDENAKFGMYANGAVSCDVPHCAQIAKSMLAKGGSVVDGAIAGLLCMGVVHPQSSGIGGGFLAVIYNGTTKESKVLNARETAPSFATESMFHGEWQKSQLGGLAVAIPGEIKGYWELWEKYSLLPWSDLFEPTIKLARNGFSISAHTATSLNTEWEVIEKEPSMSTIFMNPETSKPYREGDHIKFETLATTLEEIANNHASEFYDGGKIGQWFIEDLYEHGGNMSLDDLKNYKVEWTEPLKIELHGNITMYATPPPGSGLLQGLILNILSGYNLNSESIDEQQNIMTTYQRIIESFKHAFAYRTQLGDPMDNTISSTVKELIHTLTSEEFGASIRKKIAETESKTNNTYEFYGAKLYLPDDHGTAHISIIGPTGDAIAITSTINTYFGARIRSNRTGIIYNNEMDDFSAPGITNYFGIPPSINNFIKPGKRPLSSMTPSIFVDENGHVKLCLGAAGGTKIITSSTWAAIQNLWLGTNIEAAVDEPRPHHQLYPMELDLEDGFPEYVYETFTHLGHKLHKSSLRSAVTGISRNENGLLEAKADKRKPGSVSGF